MRIDTTDRELAVMSIIVDLLILVVLIYDIFYK